MSPFHLRRRGRKRELTGKNESEPLILVFVAIINVVRNAGLIKYSKSHRLEIGVLHIIFRWTKKDTRNSQNYNYLKNLAIKLSIFVFSIELNTANVTNIRNPPKCLQNLKKFNLNSLKFKYHSTKQIKI